LDKIATVQTNKKRWMTNASSYSHFDFISIVFKLILS